MGTVIIGGLLSSLFLTLFLRPGRLHGIMSRVDNAAKRRLERKIRLAAQGDDDVDGVAVGAPGSPSERELQPN